MTAFVSITCSTFGVEIGRPLPTSKAALRFDEVKDPSVPTEFKGQQSGAILSSLPARPLPRRLLLLKVAVASRKLNHNKIPASNQD